MLWCVQRTVAWHLCVFNYTPLGFDGHNWTWRWNREFDVPGEGCTSGLVWLVSLNVPPRPFCRLNSPHYTATLSNCQKQFMSEKLFFLSPLLSLCCWRWKPWNMKCISTPSPTPEEEDSQKNPDNPEMWQPGSRNYKQCYRHKMLWSKNLCEKHIEKWTFRTPRKKSQLKLTFWQRDGDGYFPTFFHNILNTG